MAGKKVIGVLALQGAFLEHQQLIEQCRARAVKVRTAEDLEHIDGLIIPGGESTAIGRLLVDFDLGDPIREKAKSGMPLFGTCAGMIILAREIPGYDQYNLGLMNMSVKRNAFGRQVDSFETNLKIKGISRQVKGVFIRAPYADRVWGEAEVLGVLEEKIVMVREGSLLASSFHPELSGDPGIHKLFLGML